MTVPIIPVKRQQLILETHIEQLMDHYLSFSRFPSLGPEIKEQLVTRLRGGQAKYGTAWCEVDLRTDAAEECLDLFNYLFMMIVRQQHAAMPLGLSPVEVPGVLFVWLAEVYNNLQQLPRFEGPTSKDWIIQQGLDPARQQELFQEQLFQEQLDL